MKFIVAATAFCVATVAITSVDAAKAERKDKQKAATSRILRKKLPTKGEAAAAAINEAEDKVLAEDEGYWERFLQNEVPSMPTPSPTGTCDTKVSLALGRDKRIVFAVLVIWHNMCAGCDLFPFF